GFRLREEMFINEVGAHFTSESWAMREAPFVKTDAARHLGTLYQRVRRNPSCFDGLPIDIHDDFNQDLLEFKYVQGSFLLAVRVAALADFGKTPRQIKPACLRPLDFGMLAFDGPLCLWIHWGWRFDAD